MIPDPDSNSQNPPAVINNLTNILMWAVHKFTTQSCLNIQVVIKFCDWQQQQREIIYLHGGMFKCL